MSYMEAYDFHTKEVSENKIHLKEANQFLNKMHKIIDSVFPIGNIDSQNLYKNEIQFTEKSINELKEVFSYQHQNKIFLSKHKEHIQRSYNLIKEIEFEKKVLSELMDVFDEISKKEIPFFNKNKVIQELRNTLYHLKYEVVSKTYTFEGNLYEEYIDIQESYIKKINIHTDNKELIDFYFYTLHHFSFIKKSIELFFIHHFDAVDYFIDLRNLSEELIQCKKDSLKSIEMFLNFNSKYNKYVYNHSIFNFVKNIDKFNRISNINNQIFFFNYFIKK